MTIYVKIYGGLGNQMFQFAAGYAAAKNKKTKLSLDLDYYKKNNLHNNFELQKVFDIKSNVNILVKSNKFNFFKIIKQFDFTVHKFNENQFHYNKNILNISNNTILDGYWQSERYFKKYENEIKKIFTFKVNLNKIEYNYFDEIYNNNSVSVHIRRGDFLLKKNDNHKTDLNDYYLEAIKRIAKKFYKVKFYLFTDDPNWVRNYFNMNYDHKIVDINQKEKSYIDMYFMSLCKANIIANSTFSWWSAWLNNNNDKIICAPRNWFNDKTINTDDLIPRKWLLI